MECGCGRRAAHRAADGYALDQAGRRGERRIIASQKIGDGSQSTGRDCALEDKGQARSESCGQEFCGG
jgi:hypothetical protein